MKKQNKEIAYTATKPLEHKRQSYKAGDVVKELTEVQAKRLLEAGAIKEKK